MNTLSVNAEFFAAHAPKGGFCIDATAGNGHDTLTLCRLVGEGGKVLAFDIQKQAVENTARRLKENGFDKTGSVILDSHANMQLYAEENTVDLIVFNLGWLPGGDHSIFTRPESTAKAIEASLKLLKPGGAVSVSIYYGGKSGYEERDFLMEYLKNVDPKAYTVFKTEFYNRTGDVPISVFIFKAV